MKISTTSTPVSSIAADAVVVGIYQDEPLNGAAAQLDEANGSVISDLMQREEFSGKKNQLLTLHALGSIEAKQVVLLGLGKKDSLDTATTFQACGSAAKSLAAKARGAVAFYLDADWDASLAESAVCGAIVGCVGQDLYRAEKNLHCFEELCISGIDDSTLEQAVAIGESINYTRDLVNGPPQDIYPESFADSTKAMAEECGLQIEIWDEAKLTEEKCGALLAVNRGSDRPPRLVIMRHQGGDKSDPTLALIGKGVTFDSGGLSLKPSDGMKTMKMDMAGAGTVAGAMQAIARLKLPVNVVGLVGLVENLVSGDAYKLGDVLTARSGKTIEVLNTDAEGRLVLADVISVALDEKPEKMIDLATLTGACVVALGNDVAGLFSNDQAWCEQVKAAADACGELTWPLPMFKLFDKQIQSKVADIKNIGEGRWGGAITAAKFLQEFVDDKTWVHMDIAGPAFYESSKSWCDAGASGLYVRTLVEVARNWNK